MKIGIASGSRSRPRCEELARADRRLQPRVALDRLRPVAHLGFLQRIAALVVAERICVLAPVLERLAEREAQMVAILGARRRASASCARICAISSSGKR